MTANQIAIELKKIYPGLYITVPIHCIGLYEPNYNEWWIETNVVPGQHRQLGTGRSPKKAWIEAWKNKDKYKELAGIAEEVKKVYPDATWRWIKINNWKEKHVICKTSKPFTECEENNDFASDSIPFDSPDEAWMSAYKNLQKSI